jgi:AraC family transcriptional regulator
MTTTMNSYSGTLRRRMQTMHLSVGEYSYPGRCRIARHRHELPFLSLLSNGRYREAVESARGPAVSEIAGPAVVVHPAGERHQDEFDAEGATIFSVDMPQDWFEAAAVHNRSVNTGPHVSAAVLRVAREMERGGEAAQWFVEAAILDLVGSLARASHRGQGKRLDGPGWVKRIADYLQDNYARKMPLAELAGIAGVHPVYMARHFHKTYACTIGDYVRALRVERALADLLHSDHPLADIAAAHGFSDQSHLSRLVRSRTGLTPGQWRKQRSG